MMMMMVAVVVVVMVRRPYRSRKPLEVLLLTAELRGLRASGLPASHDKRLLKRCLAYFPLAVLPHVFWAIKKSGKGDGTALKEACFCLAGYDICATQQQR